MIARSLATLPKAHLHLHLDGSYPRAAVERLAARHGRTFEVPLAYTSVDDFFARYLTVPDLVTDLDDLAMLCAELVRHEAAEGVLYCEPNIEPQLFAPRLGSARAVLVTMLRAFAMAAADTSIEVGALVIVNTDAGLEPARQPAELAVEYAGDGVTAFGTAGFVEPAGLSRFASLAAKARDAGLKIVCHAGQTGGPDSIRDALDSLAPDRIAHGVQAVADASLMTELAERRVVLDVALSSNVALGIVPSLTDHPVRRLIDAGVPVTLNADDELWFGSSITAEYELARTVVGLDDSTLASLAVNGALATNITPQTRAALIDGASSWLDSHPSPDPDGPSLAS
jgi:adenosine deaminase